MAGKGIADEYSVNIIGCQHDSDARQLIFSGEEMAVFFPKRPEALRISDPGTPLQITAFRKGVPLTFNPTSCKTAKVSMGGTGGEVDLSCNEKGNILTVVVGFSECGLKQ